MDAFSYIKNHVFVKLKPSPLAGIGVFSIRDIPVDTFLFTEWQGETRFYPITQFQLNELEYELREHIRDMFLFSSDFPTDTNIYVKLIHGCHWIYTNPYHFINSGFYKKNSNVDKDSMKSTRFIKKGEELLSNYERYEKIDKKIL
jgi:hypothetical protein